MASSEIKILIRVIGNRANESVIRFLKEKPGIEKLYLIHKVTTEKDFQNPDEEINFLEIAEEFKTKLEEDWDELTIIPKVLNDDKNFHEIQKIVSDIEHAEQIASNGMLNTLEDVAIDISGGTAIVTASLLFSAFRLRITPYFVQPKTVRTNNRVEKIEIPYRKGQVMGKPDSPGNKILKNLAHSVFTIREFEGRNYFETPEGKDEKPVLGMKTQYELNKELKEEVFEDMSLVEHLTDVSLKDLQEDIDKYLGEEEDKKEEKKKKTFPNPLKGISELFKPVKIFKKKAGKYEVKKVLEAANSASKQNCLIAYDVFKKAHRMMTW